MQRVLWKGVISFGLLNLPVDLYAAEEPSELDLDLLDRRDMAPVGYQRINKDSGEQVPAEDIVKGYEYEDGRYVLLSDEDLKRANPLATQTVELFAFVQQQEIPLVHYEKPYYLVPAKRAEKGYALLRETLRRAGKLGVARVIIRSKQHLAALVPLERMLVLNLLRWPQEIRPLDDYHLPDKDLAAAGISEKEVQMALALVEGMSESWQPEHYHDTYHADVMSMIEARIKAGATQQMTSAAEDSIEPVVSGDVVDFMALLKKSIADRKQQGTASAAPPSAKRVATKAKKPTATGGDKPKTARRSAS